MDPVCVEVRVEGVHEDQPGHLVAISTAEHPDIVAAVRVADQHERRHLTSEIESAPKVVHGVREGVPSARIARAASRPVVGAGASCGRELTEHRAPEPAPLPIPASSTTVGEPSPRQSRYSDRPPMSTRSPSGTYGAGRL